MDDALRDELRRLQEALPWLTGASGIYLTIQPGGDSVAVFCTLGSQMWQRVRVMVFVKNDGFGYELRLQMSKPGTVADDPSEGQIYDRLAACEALEFDDPLNLLVVMAGLRSIGSYALV